MNSDVKFYWLQTDCNEHMFSMHSRRETHMQSIFSADCIDDDDDDDWYRLRLQPNLIVRKVFENWVSSKNGGPSGIIIIRICANNEVSSKFMPYPHRLSQFWNVKKNRRKEDAPDSGSAFHPLRQTRKKLLFCFFFVGCLSIIIMPTMPCTLSVCPSLTLSVCAFFVYEQV